MGGESREKIWAKMKLLKVKESVDVIIELRKHQNLSQDEMAGRLFVTRQAVSRWETGETVPNTETLKLISKEFIEHNIEFLDSWNEENGLTLTLDEARVQLRAFLPTLKRWKAR